MSEYDSYYDDHLQTGLEYQDWVVNETRKHDVGLIIIPTSSKKYQIKFGESFTGVEIKNDCKMKESGNIFFEIEEKSRTELSSFTQSGIYRQDKCMFYLIGDYEQAFLFSKKQLQEIHKNEYFKKRHGISKDIVIKRGTSKGFLWPISDALNTSILLMHFKFYSNT